MDEARIGTEPSGEIVDGFVASDRFGKPLTAALACGLLCKLALVVGLKRDAFGIHPLQVTRNFGRIDAGIEIIKVPFRQLARLAGGLLGVPWFGCGFASVRFAEGGRVTRSHLD